MFACFSYLYIISASFLSFMLLFSLIVEIVVVAVVIVFIVLKQIHLLLFTGYKIHS